MEKSAMNAVPDKLFRPESLVVVGASADSSKLSSIPLRNLKNMGYAGRMYAVNPNAREIDGIPSFPDIASLPEVPDVAFLVVPGERALKVATECAQRGVAATVVASTGFAEVGPEGAKRQEALTALVDVYGMRVVGPNTNGLYSAHDRLSLGYNAAHAEIFAPGNVSVVSHSGALFHSIAERMRSMNLGIAKFVAVGNEADLDLLDFFEHLANDDISETILMVVEAVNDGARLRSIAARARAAGKRVGALKLGVTLAGAASTVAHSSRLAGSARAYAALFEAAGIGVASSVDSLVAFARLSHGMPRGWAPAGRGLGLITASGAGGTLLADSASHHGFDVATLEPDTTQALRQHMDGAEVFNPLDVANFGRSTNTPNTAPSLSQDPNVSALVAFAHKLQTPAQREAYAKGIASGAVQSGKPHMAVAAAALPVEQMALFEEGGVPVFFETASAFEGLRVLFDSAYGDDAALEKHAASLVPNGSAIDENAVELNEFDSMSELDGVGLKTVARACVQSVEEAIAFSLKHGWPLVLKGVVDGVAHKSDAGLVILDLDSPLRLQEAYDRLQSMLNALPSGASGTPARARIVVQKMEKGGFELIAGVTSEAPLGRFLLVGLGGRQAEYIDDVRLWALPVSEHSIRAGLAQTTIARVVQGGRWKRTQTIDEIVQVLMRLQDYALKEGARLQAVEINPLLIGDFEPLALDALVVRILS